ncbi:hypothetical protein CRE_30978 [Caenorhabditis remanei]|uniref:Uncharacterized protein n=1 Tax=Caenorhabditis remanei TaxID=31234 RepID=E3LTW4_CAERE|nr:hypothetical protein CRE_30978 [Caenorhabditis remanei]
MASQVWFIVLVLVVTTSAKSFTNVSAFPEMLYGSNLTNFRKECPDQLSQMDSCIVIYRDCFGLMRATRECDHQFCGCVGESGYIRDDSTPQKCLDHLNSACVTVRSKGNLFKNQIVEENTKSAVNAIEKNLNQIRSAHKTVVEQCGIESKIKDEEARMLASLNTTNRLFPMTMTFFAMVNVEKFISKSEKCQKSIDLYERALQNLDEATVNRLEIPYRFWFIGAEFGSIGRVVTRALAVETCENASPELNHHSVVRVNCYDRRVNRSACDEKYRRDTKHTLSTTESKKLKCKMFIDLVEQVQSLRAAQFYEEAVDYHENGLKIDVNGDSLTRGFEGFFKGSMTRRETKNDIVRLEASQNSPLILQQLYDDVSMSCGKSKNTADVVTSCAFKYAYCIHKIKKECMIQLSICLDHIDGIDGICEEKIKEISSFLWPSTATTPVPTGESNAAKAITRGAKEDSFWWIARMIALFVFIVVITLLIISIGAAIYQQGCVSGARKICGEKHSINQGKQEEDRLVETPSSSSSDVATAAEIDAAPRNDESNDQEPLDGEEEIARIGNDDNYEIIQMSNNQEDSQHSNIKTETDSIHNFIIIPQDTVDHT